MSAPSRPRRLAEGVAWLAGAIAFSPVLCELASSLRQTDASWPIVLAPGLLALWIARAPAVPPHPRRGGLALLSTGLALELLGIASHSWSIARLGLPIGFLGLSGWLGRPPLRVSLLAFGAWPLPSFVLALPSPWLESAFASLACLVIEPFDPGLASSGPLLRSGEVTLDLAVNHGGLPLAATMAQLAWYAGLRRDWSLDRSAAAVLGGVVLALPLQALGACGAALLLARGRPDLGLAWLDFGLLGLVCVVALGWVELRGPRSSEGSR